MNFSDHRRWAWACRGLLALLAVVMLSTFLDYGMTGDEGVQHRYARRLLRWYATLGQDTAAAADVDVSMYGGLFELTAEAATLVSPLDPFETRHLANVLFALLAFFAVGRMASRLAGTPAAGVAAIVCLALTPPFYGHAFNNPKDIPFAGTFALAVSLVLDASGTWPAPSWRRVLAAGVGMGLACGVRVGGIVLYGYALVLWLGMLQVHRAPGGALAARQIALTARAWVVSLAVGWVVMIAFWPWAQTAPLRNPFRALRAFHGFWDTMVLFFDGRLVLSGEVSRFYLPTWFALTLPEFYGVAALMAVVTLFERLRRAPLSDDGRCRLWQAAWLAGVVVAPVSWVVVSRMPLYDGLRHFLFVMPLMAALAGVALATFLTSGIRPRVKWVVGGTLALSWLVTLADMRALHPYQTVYFNRLVAGGLRNAWARYETDYWCLTYKEGTDWLVRRYAGAQCPEKIRVAGHSILLQTSYYLQKTEEGQRLFKAVSTDARPHFVLATTRYGDHQRTPGRVVHRVERQGAPLLWIFEQEAPPCHPSN